MKSVHAGSVQKNSSRKLRQSRTTIKALAKQLKIYIQKKEKSKEKERERERERDYQV